MSHLQESAAISDRRPSSYELSDGRELPAVGLLAAIVWGVPLPVIAARFDVPARRVREVATDVLKDLLFQAGLRYTCRIDGLITQRRGVHALKMIERKLGTDWSELLSVQENAEIVELMIYMRDVLPQILRKE